MDSDPFKGLDGRIGGPRKQDELINAKVEEGIWEKEMESWKMLWRLQKFEGGKG